MHANTLLHRIRPQTAIAIVATLISFSGQAFAQDLSVVDRMDPELREVGEAAYAATPGITWSDAELQTIRAATTGMAGGAVDDDIPVQAMQVPGREGDPYVTVYVVNAQDGTAGPGILHLHGGGQVAGTAEAFVPVLQGLAKETGGGTFVTVEYRLAPETTYEGSNADAYAALSWMHANAAQIGVDPDKIAVMGESAGGNQAAVLAINARDRGEIPLVAQILIYPMLDDRTGSTHTLPDFIGAVLWTPEANRYGWKSYLGMEPGGEDVPAAAVPSRVEDLSGLPATFIGVGNLDLFVTEDITYAQRLIEAGVPTDLLVVPGAYHGFDMMVPEAEVSKRFKAAFLDALRRAFE